MSTVIWILSVTVCCSIWVLSPAEADTTDDALTDSVNQYISDRLLYNLRSSVNQNRQKPNNAVGSLIRTLYPVDSDSSSLPSAPDTGNKNVLLHQVLARLDNTPFKFGGPNESPLLLLPEGGWRQGDAGNLQHDGGIIPVVQSEPLDEDDMSKRWGSGPGPRGKRLAIDLRERRRDGPGPRGKRQGPRGKKQGPRGKKGKDEDTQDCK